MGYGFMSFLLGRILGFGSRFDTRGSGFVRRLTRVKNPLCSLLFA
jgi:hypothetical protein